MQLWRTKAAEEQDYASVSALSFAQGVGAKQAGCLPGLTLSLPAMHPDAGCMHCTWSPLPQISDIACIQFVAHH